MKFVHKTHRGNIREINEDFYYIPNENENLYIVADGMGGHLAGETASKMAVEIISEEIKKLSFNNEKELIDGFQDVIKKTNRIIYKKSVEDIKLRGMGTTLSLGYIYNNKLYYTNIGDSRIYKIDTDIKQITKDDSFVNYLVELGEITPDEAKTHPKKNVITKALGTSENIDVEMMSFNLQHEKILICSDGLTNMVSDEEILEVLNTTTFENSVDVLMDRALKAGGVDNITIIIIDVE